jgi:hypothetical protein
MTKTKCSCGGEKPYRRAYGCKECWERLGEQGQEMVVRQNLKPGSDRKNWGKRSLRLV